MRQTKDSRRLVVVIAYDGAQLLDVAGPAQAFATANEMAAGEEGGRDTAQAPYRIVTASRRGGMIRTSSGLSFATGKLAAIARAGGPIDTLIVVGGAGVHDAARDGALIRFVIKAAPKTRRVCSVCTGAFVLAAAGLLSGRRASTHWQSCALLQQRYPDIRVEPEPIYVRDGPIWTSAGVTAGIDLALALVEADLGRRLAMQVARQLVVFLKRPGGQSQFSAPLEAQAAAANGDDRFARLQAWMVENLDSDLRVERLAEQAGMSPRSFARAFVASQGTTPARAVESIRVEAARRALEESGAAVKRIASDCGFGDEERMRRAFLRRLKLNPLEYRRRFAG